jgi:hypothetical protein
VCPGTNKTVSSSEKRVLRPNTGNRLRVRAKTARLRFVETDVTPEEHGRILDYCLQHKISVSQFLADLILRDAATAKNRKGTTRLSIEFDLTHEEFEKLELLVHLHKKDDVSDLIRGLLQPHLDLQRIHVPIETRSVRFYLSEHEHAIVTKHIASRGITARKYVSFLALKEIAKVRKGRK